MLSPDGYSQVLVLFTGVGNPMISGFRLTNRYHKERGFYTAVSPYALRFNAAWKSRSMTFPQHSQRYMRSCKVSVDFTAPHWQHSLELGKNLSAVTKRMLFPLHLYSVILRNSRKLCCCIAFDKCRFFIMPDTFKSSIHMKLGSRFLMSAVIWWT